LKSKYKIWYDHQSVQSVAGKLSCRRTALNRIPLVQESGLSSLARAFRDYRDAFHGS